MSEQGIHWEELPQLQNPILIAGFEGWGNALNVSNATATYLIRQLKAVQFATIDPDLFYRYDENRPLVHIEDGILKGVSPHGGTFYAAMTPEGQRDLVILKSREPSLRWMHFTQALLHLCDELDVETVFSLGSMYDNVLHSDRILSGVASDQALLSGLKENGLIPINYQGPGAIHSTIMSACASSCATRNLRSIAKERVNSRSEMM